MFGEGGVLEDLGDGGDTSEGGRTAEALWTEGAAAVTWELGGFGSMSEEERVSGGRGLADFLCLDLGEG